MTYVKLNYPPSPKKKLHSRYASADFLNFHTINYMKKIMRRNTEGIIFDLDNVLYDETSYIFAAYSEIAQFLSKNYGIDRHFVYKKLINDFKRKGSMYPRLFNDLLEELKLDNGLLPKILHIYSSVKPEIKLYKGAKSLLNKLSIRYKLGLLTNGSIEAQKNKICLLGIEKYFNRILYARKFGRDYEKPNAAVFDILIKDLKTEPRKAVYIGDNPFIDFVGAKKLGMFTIRLLKGEFKNAKVDKEYDADVKIDNIFELKKIYLN